MILAYFIPLTCGLIVAMATLVVKRAIQEGAGEARIFFITNWIFLLALLPILFTNVEVLDWSRWWGPVLAGFSAFIGGVFLLASIRSGEVSVQTTLMGTKVLFVAIYTIILTSAEIPMKWWGGAFLTFFAIFILGIGNLSRKTLSFKGIFYAIGGAAFYAMTDVLAAQQAPLFGRWPFIFCMGCTLAIMSLGLVPFFRKNLWSIPKATWKWCIFGGILTVIQHLGLLFALSYYGMATALNILYSSRGLWGVILVWVVGHWFGNEEKRVGSRIMISRMIAAILLTIAICIVLIEGVTCNT